MCKPLIAVIFLGSIFLFSCKNTSLDKEKKLLEKELELTKKELELSKKEVEIQEKEKSKPQKHEKLVLVETKSTSSTILYDTQDDPVKIMQVIFEAAKTNNFSKLSELCDPTGSGDNDTKSICNIASQSFQLQKEFKEYFQNGKVIGSALISGNSASVKFQFGPDGNKNEEMHFSKVNGKWYLSSF